MPNFATKAKAQGANKPPAKQKNRVLVQILFARISTLPPPPTDHNLPLVRHHQITQRQQQRRDGDGDDSGPYIVQRPPVASGELEIASMSCKPALEVGALEENAASPRLGLPITIGALPE
jgi:hypothetical protein